MEPVASTSILSEVRDFLSSLRTEWPEVFAVAKRPVVEAPAPVALTPLAAGMLVPDVAVDAPARALPEGDLVALFRSRAELYAPALGVTFGSVKVKDQRSLWGSCSAQGNLNFSWRLALAPEPVLDYLVVHELAHRAQMNHSKRFWAVVARACPGHKSHRRWLRKNGRALLTAPRPA